MKQQKTGRLSLRGWFGRMLRQPPRGFYGQPSVYLSGGVMEIEHFRRVRTYEEGRLCPTVSTTKDGPEQIQAGSRASASSAVS